MSDPRPEALDLDAIRARLANASGGPWRLPYEDGAIARPYDDGDRQLDLDMEREPDEVDDVSLLGLDEDGMAIVARRADAELIAAAPSDLAALLAEVEALRETNDRLWNEANAATNDAYSFRAKLDDALATLTAERDEARAERDEATVLLASAQRNA